MQVGDHELGHTGLLSILDLLSFVPLPSEMSLVHPVRGALRLKEREPGRLFVEVQKD